MKNVKASTIIRTVVLLLALVNQGLIIAGLNVLPITEDQVTEVLSLVFTIGASLWAWWKNNSFTEAAIKADELMAELKGGDHDEAV